LSRQKGHEIALCALAGLKKYSWQLEIVGTGELEESLKQPNQLAPTKSQNALAP
jgi:glycogen synthase